MTFSDDFLEQIRSANPIETVMQSYVHLLRRGRNYVCNCPFHSEKTPSCTIFPETQSFYCFGCGAGGDVITFLRRVENLEFVDAVKLLAQRSGLEVPDSKEADRISQVRIRTLSINREAANFYYRNLSGADKRGLQYLASRRLSPATIKKYGLGYAPDAWSQLSDYLLKKGYTKEELLTAGVAKAGRNGGIYDMFRGRVMFPIVDVRGNVIGFGGRVLDQSQPKYLNTAKTPVFDKGSNLFSLNFAKNSNSAIMILAEGYMDVIAINQAGFSNVVATLGTAITPEQARKIGQYAKEVVIAYDSDTAGQTATQRAIHHFSDAGITTRILHMEGAKDPDEFIKTFGADRFRLLVEAAGDAINFRLDQCEKGLDLQTEAGRVQLLKRLVDVLAAIPNELEREVYISRTAQKWEVDGTVLRTQIQRRLRASKKIQQSKAWKDVIHHTVQPQPGASISNAQLCRLRAQERILCYLLNHPEAGKDLQNDLPAEQFSDSLYQRLYQHICTTTQVSSLSRVFSDEEMGKISGITAKYTDIPVTEADVRECITLLQEPPESEIKNDQDLLRLVQANPKHRQSSEW